MNQANANWVRQYDWMGKYLGEEPAVYWVERWDSPLRRLIRRMRGL